MFKTEAFHCDGVNHKWCDCPICRGALYCEDVMCDAEYTDADGDSE